MGEYLSKPNVEKDSSNEHLAHLSYGASTMQGWRSSQEDAHNCIPEFDENTALFAVYDGHGGSEVAQYCAINLPSYISSLESYKSGNIAQALEDGFLGFDAILTTESVISVLKKLSKGSTDMDDEDSVPDEDELQQLRQEAEIPTETLKEYYHFKRCAPEKSDEIPQSPSSQPSQSSPVETNSSNAKDQGEKCQIANGETEGKDSSVAHVKEGDSEIVQEKNSEDLDRVTHEGGDCEKPDESSTCTGKGKKIKKDSKLVEDADQSKPGCSSLDEAGPSQHPEPKRKRKLPVVTHVNSDSEESDVEDETYEGDDHDDSESNDDEDEEDDSSSEESDDDNEEQDGGDDDDEWEDIEEIPIQDMALRGGACNSGCTAVVAVLRGCELYVANAGDSRCIVSRKGKAIEMSVDHKPEDEREKIRIIMAGGKVWQGRVNGDLNLSRAIGDHRFKQNKAIEPKDQMISALPDIRTLTIDPEEDEFLILACDGIWNYMSSQEVVDFIRKRLTDDTEDISKICEQLFDHCLAPNTSGDGTGCDNMTAIIVKFHPTLGQHVSASHQRTPHKLHKVKDHDKPQLEETESKKAKLDSSCQQSSATNS